MRTRILALLFVVMAVVATSIEDIAAQTKDYCAGDLIIDLTYGGNTTPNNTGMTEAAVYDGYELMFALVGAGIHPEWVIRDPKTYEQYDLVNVSTADGVLSFASGPFVIDVSDFPRAQTVIDSIKLAGTATVAKVRRITGSCFSVNQDWIYPITFLPRVVAGDDNGHDEMDMIDYPYFEILTPGTVADPLTVAGGGLFFPEASLCSETRRYDIYILGHYDWTTPSAAELTAIAELDKFINQGGLGIFECLSASIEETAHWLTYRGTEAEYEDDLDTGEYMILPGNESHPFVQSMGDLYYAGGAFPAWRYPNDVNNIPYLRDEARNILWGWNADVPQDTAVSYLFGPHEGGYVYYHGGHQRDGLSNQRLTYNSIAWYAARGVMSVSMDPEETSLGDVVTVNSVITGGSKLTNYTTCHSIYEGFHYVSGSATIVPTSIDSSDMPDSLVLCWDIGDIEPSDYYAVNGVVFSYQIVVDTVYGEEVVPLNASHAYFTFGDSVVTSGPECLSVPPSVWVNKALIDPPAGTVLNGDTVSFQIQVLNTGGTQLTTVPLSDRYDPACLGYLSAVPAPNSVTSGLISWSNLGPLNMMDDTIVTVRFRTLAACGLTPDTATVVGARDLNGTYADNDTSVAVIDIQTYVVIEADKVDTDINGGLLEGGDRLRYTIVIRNTGVGVQNDNPGSEFEDIIPANTTYDGSYTPTASNGFAFFDAPDRITWDGEILAGDSVIITFQVILDSPLVNRTEIANQGTVYYDEFGTGNNNSTEPTDDPDIPAENDSTRSVVGSPVVKAVDKATAVGGEILSYTVSFELTEQGLLSGAVVSDPIPTGTTYINGSANAGGGLSGGNVTWNLGSNVAGIPGSNPYAGGTFSTTLPAVADDWLQQDSGGNDNHGTDNELYTRPNPPTQDYHAILRFDLSGIPSGANITSATFGIYETTTRDATQTITLYRLTQSWTELGATWLTRDGTTIWTTPGGTYAPISLGSFSPTSTGFKTFNVASTVQNWVNGTYSNEGFILVATTTSQTGDVRFASRENGTVANRPYLQVAYQVGPALTTSLDALPRLVTSTDNVTVTMSVASTQQVLGVTPSALSFSGTNGVTATLVSGPTPASQTVPANTPVTFTWEYNVSELGNIGQATFSGNATGGGYTWPSATSNSSIVSPPLTFQVRIIDPPVVSEVVNTAYIEDSSVFPDPYPSNEALTDITGIPEIEVTKTLVTPAGGAAKVGDTVSFQITMQNMGTSSITQLPLTDRYTASCLSFVSASPAQSNQSSGAVNWSNLGPLAAGATLTVTVNFTALSACGVSVDTARVQGALDEFGRSVPTDVDTAVITLVQPGIEISKTRTVPAGSAVLPGDPVTFTIAVQNTGTSDLSTIRLQDRYNPSCLSFVSANPAPSTTISGLVAWTNVGPVDVGSSRTITMNFMALAACGVTLDTARVFNVRDEYDLGVPEDTDTAFVNVVEPEVSVTKTRTVPAGAGVGVGGSVTYQVLIQNTGTSNLTTVPLADHFNSGCLSFVSANPAQTSQTGGNVTWANVGPIAVGGSRTVTVNFTALAPCGATIDTAMVQGAVDQYGQTAPGASDTAYVDVVQASMSVTKTRTAPVSGMAGVGDPVTFQVQVQNTGTTTLSTVPLTDAFNPTCLSFVSASPVQSFRAGGTIYWVNLGSIAPGASRTVTLNFTALSPCGVTIDTAMVQGAVDQFGTTVPTRQDTASVSLLAPDLDVTKTRTTAEMANIGDPVTFQIVLQNSGNTTLTNLPLSDDFNATCLNFVSASPVQTIRVGGTIYWANLGSLAPGASRTVTLNFTALAACGVSIDTALVQGAQDVYGHIIPNQQDTAFVRLVQPGVVVTKTLINPPGGTATQGNNVVFRISIENTGSTNITQLPLLDDYQESCLSPVSATVAWSSNNGSVLTWNNLGTLAPGGTRSIDITFLTIAPCNPATNVAVVNQAFDQFGAPVPASQDDATVTIITGPTVNVGKTLVTPAGGVAEIGDPVSFQITLQNTGGTSITQLPLTDLFNATCLSFVSANPVQSSLTSGTVNWSNLGPLAVGASRTITVNFTALNSCGVSVDTARVQGALDQYGTTVPAQQDTALVRLIDLDLGITKNRITAQNANIGDPVSFQVIIHNAGTTTLVTVPLSDRFNNSCLSFISASPAQTSIAGGTINWANVGPIAAGASQTVTINFTAANACGTTIDTAEVNGALDQYGFNAPAASDTAYVTLAIPGLEVSKTRNTPAGSATVGSPVVFEVLVQNIGATTLATVPLLDTYDPSCLNFVSASPAQSSQIPGRIIWNHVGSIAPGGSRIVTINFTAIAACGVTLDTARVHGALNEFGVPIADQEDRAYVEIIEAQSGMLVTKNRTTDEMADVGDPVGFQVVVQNTGSRTLTTVPLTDLFNTSCLSFVSASPAQTSRSGGTITWANIGPITAGASRTVTLSFTALSPCGVTVDTARVQGAQDDLGIVLPVQTDTAYVRVVQPGLIITKTLLNPPGGTATQGNNVTFRIAIENTGTTLITQLPLLDDYQESCLSPVSASVSWSSNTGSVLTWNNLGPLAAGASRTIDVVFSTIAQCNPATNVAVVSQAVDEFGSPVPASQDDATVTIVSGPTVNVTKTLVTPASGAAKTGDAVAFQITLQNTGGTSISLLPLTDLFNSSCLSFVSANPVQSSQTSGTITWSNLGPLAAGASRTVTVNFTVASPCGVSINTARVQGAQDQFGTTLPTQQDTASVNLVQPNLTVAKTRTTAETANIGEDVTYTILISNTGTTSLVAVPLIDDFNQVCLQFISANPVQTNQAGGTIAWSNVGPIAAGASRTVTVNFTALTACGLTIDTAVVSGAVDQHGFSVPVQQDTAFVRTLQSGMSVTKTRTTGEEANVGDAVAFQVVVQNTGNTVLTNVPLADRFSSSCLSFVSANPAQTSLIGGRVNWTNVGPIAAGASRTVTMNFTALNACGVTIDTAFVQGATDEYGSTVPTRTDTAFVRVLQPGLDVSKALIDPAGGSTDFGNNVRFRITLQNTGNTTITQLPVLDDYPQACLTPVSATLPWSSDNGSVLTWNNVGPLAPGSSRQIDVTFRADAVCSPATNVAVVNQASDEYGTPVPADQDDATVTITAPVSDFQLSKILTVPSDGTARVGDLVVFQILITNIGETTIQTLPLTDAYTSSCLSYASASQAPSAQSLGSLSWSNLGPLSPGGSVTVTVGFMAIGPCGTTINRTTVTGAVDEFAVVLPAQSKTASVVISCDDQDGDGVCDDTDNCPSVSNSNQADADQDGMGNVCDPCPYDAFNDYDHDGLCANVDNCPTTYNPNQADSDRDGIGDACDFSSTYPDIGPPKTIFDIGDVPVGACKDSFIVISNDGNAHLHIFSITSNCDEFDVLQPPTYPLTIAPFGCEHIPIRFCPTQTGGKSCSLTILSDDPDESTVIVPVRGDGTSGQQNVPNIVVSSSGYNYGDVQIGSTSTWSFTISNTGTASLSISSVTSGNSDFDVTNPASFPRTVTAGGSLTVTIVFSPSTTGARTTTVTIVSNDPDQPIKTVSLQGNGVTSGAAVSVYFPTAYYGVPGSIVTVDVYVDNQTSVNEAIAGLQLGITFDDDVLSVTNVVSTSRTAGMDLFQWSEPTGGQLSILCADFGGGFISPAVGSVARVTFQISSGATLGDSLVLHFVETVLSDVDAGLIPVSSLDGMLVLQSGGVLLGDVNGDGDVNVLDIVLVANFVLEIMTPTSQQLQASDCNQDGSINILDMVGIANVILGTGTCPPSGTMKLGAASPAILEAGEISRTSRLSVEAPLVISTEREMAGFQLVLSYDPHQMTPGLPALTQRSASMVLAFDAGDGMLRVVVYSVDGSVIEGGVEPVITIPFDLKGATSLNEGLELNCSEVILAASCTEVIPVDCRPINIKIAEVVPAEFALSQNYPNPFNPTTSIQFAVGSGQLAAYVTVKVFNVMGQEVATLVEGIQEPGYHEVTWDASELSSGVYFCRLVAGDYSQTRRMVLMK